jgi:hypothetical protein
MALLYVVSVDRAEMVPLGPPQEGQDVVVRHVVD